MTEARGKTASFSVMQLMDQLRLESRGERREHVMMEQKKQVAVTYLTLWSGGKPPMALVCVYMKEDMYSSMVGRSPACGWLAASLWGCKVRPHPNDAVSSNSPEGSLVRFTGTAV